MDAQSAVTQRAGVGRYARVLAEYMASAPGDDQLRLFYFDFRRKADAFAAQKIDSRVVTWLPGRLVQWGWKTLNWPPFDLLAGEADLYFFPNFVLPPLRRGKSVVTIHDMSFARFPEFAEDKNREYLAARIKDTVSRADAVLTVSQFSAAEIVELLGVDASRVFSVHHGISEDFHAPAPNRLADTLQRLGLDRPYLLTVGTLEPRKNIPFLIEVFERLTDFDGDLVIAGMPGWKYDPILDRIRTSPRARSIRYLKYVDNHDLPGLYAGASVFLLTSFYEGFGFPPLEAMACGAPVVSTSRASMAEVLGAAAILHDEFEVDAWSESVRRVLTDARHRADLIARGTDQAKRYRWENAARDTWDVFRKVVS